MGDLSEHFSRSEFRCHGFNHAGHPDHDTPVDGRLVLLLEEIRKLTGVPLRIVSGHRCPWWNVRVGGARFSQHLYGKAADIGAGRVTPAQAFQLGATGVGRRNGWAVHVDTRPGRPAQWRY